MKCVCGYEKEEAWRSDDGVQKGDEDFIYLETAVIKIENKDSYYSDKKETSLYACPKCGMVKIDL